MIPYARHKLQAEDMMEVLRILQSPSITQGPMIEWFEDVFRKSAGANYAIAVTSGTAALHAALMAAEIGPGDEVIVPSMTFVATANAVRYLNAIPVFADVDEETLLINYQDVESKITQKTKAIITMDYAGQPADYDEFRELADRYHLILIADACHSLGATYKDEKVGTLADLNCFSLHATKLITSGEGGVITTPYKKYYDRMRAFRDHGRVNGEMQYLGFNYRMTNFQAGLCIHQIERIESLVEKRQELANIYEDALKDLDIRLLKQKEDRISARHIFVIKTDFQKEFIVKLSDYGIGTQIHYKPVNLQPFYNSPGSTPIAENMWTKMITIPLYTELSDEEQITVIRALHTADAKHKKEDR